MIRLSITVVLLYSTTSIFAAPYCRPKQPCWPTPQQWSQLSKAVSGRLIKPVPTITPCKHSFKSAACQQALRNMKNPYFLQTNPADQQSVGWFDAWKPEVSAYAVAAENAHDIAVAVRFAAKHHLRLAIKGAGHDYLGRNQAPNSLLIWTHNMRDVSYDKSFVPEGAPKGTKAQQAVTVGAGARWVSAYDMATTQHGHYVQGGGCATVGAAGGFTQGSGFGSWSKKFGTGAANVLQFKIVTADGKLLTANRYQNPKLFWAVRGGGGGTFGVVTQMTLKAHPLPKHFALVQGTIEAKSNGAYRTLLQRFVPFINKNLSNEHWGENLSFGPDNKIKIFLLSQGFTKADVYKAWAPMQAFVDQAPKLYNMHLNVFEIPPRQMWNYNFYAKHYPKLVTQNTGPDARPGEFWWTTNSGEVSTYWYTYQSWWLPQKLFTQKQGIRLANIFYKVSRLDKFSFHLQKGLSGASKEAIARTRDTAIHPAAFDAVGLIIMSAGSNNTYPGVSGYAPNNKMAHLAVNKINKAMRFFINAAPQAGSYANEADYFQKNWQQAFWGANYPRLLAIKHRYDPNNIFNCHHCVGS